VLSSLITLQRKWSAAFDQLLPCEFLPDGNRRFEDEIVPAHLESGQWIYDFGGGSHPVLSVEHKTRLQAKVLGLDIDPRELEQAPEGAYDLKVVADIATFQGEGVADLVVCRALLEHVRDVEGAFRAIASSLRPGGRALVFVPSRNAWFARINLLLPQGLKRRFLFGIFPESKGSQGFQSYYHRCTPKDFEALAKAAGLNVVARHLYWSSQYFSCFLPLHMIWRGWMLLFRWVAPIQSAETFTLVMERPGPRERL
jgi:2-polyprenyl-6-hydroxyphenyl methylase/3-demethylubiquinone-9 3-methyltransferase